LGGGERNQGDKKREEIKKRKEIEKKKKKGIIVTSPLYLSREVPKDG